MKLIATEIKNNVLESMERILDENRIALLDANKKDLDAFNKDDQAMYDRLLINDKKIDGMIKAIMEVRSQDDPVNRVITNKTLENGLQVVNKTAPFGTIMIIYESRPDVTVEAAVLAFKANSKILLKGGKEAVTSNKILVNFWHKALLENGLSTEYIQLLTMDRTETQQFLKNPKEPLDLIVPRGGEKLISFVKEHAKCAVLISGRGNNFLYVDENADWEQSIEVILNAKTSKISGCNALDKILINNNLPNYHNKMIDLKNILKNNGVSIMVDSAVKNILKEEELITDEKIWKKEFLAMKCCIGSVDSTEEAIEKINTNSGGHSSTIMTTSNETASLFMEQVDCAAVYQNASTRFTDGGQMGVGAELAISTGKLHHRGPLGLNELVTNKYYVYGEGHIRE
ncbi:glutamate-5-semialdehyde dehydrogenase [Psychroserpens burtonensis]|uniref:Gamma-glutamyl phosphate reductase n=1 Tax=Psychroserpens burtonensis TaxID=49278 RepID=A0A5C7B546_9FLAO|nr:glutamate-5-semialdehyde dehydrogenase [Psychroserpens burtonensis]TXE16746.1 glutamate-5-semialdehyde dehydrogenase [Psychroserpens burtonensis]